MKRHDGANDVTDERLDQGVRFQRKSDNDDLLDRLDYNDVERILSRPSLSRRKLKIFQAPEFVQRLINYQESAAGDTVTFRAQYTSFPKPTVKWFKDEEEVSETKRHSFDLSSEADGIVRLIVLEVIRQDEGAYRCKVENQEGVASTTGYLSVSVKKSSSDKIQSKQTKKIAPDRVGAASYLRPIAEQKSMEELEEMEWQRLPPSPLQEFMGKIRHAAKSMHGPVVYADLAEVHLEEDVVKDFDSETPGDENVFDEKLGNRTPCSRPTDDLCLKDAFKSSKDKRNLPGDSLNDGGHVTDECLSPPVDRKTTEMTTKISDEDSANNSDCQGGLATVPGSGDGAVPDSAKTESKRRNLRTKLTLQRSRAVELSDTDTSSGGTTTCAKISDNGQTAPDVERHTAGRSFSDQEMQIEDIHNEIEPRLNNMSAQESAVAALGTEDFRRGAVDVAFGLIDSTWIQFFTGFVMCAVVLALSADIPPEYLVPAVVLLSLASFVGLDLHLSRSKETYDICIE